MMNKRLFATFTAFYLLNLAVYADKPVSISGNFNGHTYELSEQKKNWNMAKRDAKKRDGYLVVINSSDEQKFLEKILEEAKTRENFCEPVWIGFSDERKEGNWKWVNGDKATFTYWQKTSPVMQIA